MAGEYPFGESFQRKLLAVLVRKPEKAIDIVEPQFFTSPILVDIARLSKELLDGQSTHLSKSSLMEVVKGYLGERKSDVWPAYRRVIKKLYRRGVLRDSEVVCKEALRFAKDAKFRQTILRVEKDINSGRYDTAISRMESLKGFGVDRDLGVDYWKDLSAASRWREDRTGLIRTFYFKRLDRLMEGGVGSGELAIVMAPGKVGKSMFLARIAAGAMWQGKSVAIATGELSAKKYRKRIDAMLTGIDYQDLARKSKGKLGALNRLRSLRKLIKGDLHIKQFATGKYSIRDVENWLENLRDEGHQIDMLVLDYIRTFKPTERQEEQRMKIGQVAVELRGLAIERSIPVWTASQGNRATLSKEIYGPQDLAEDISQFWTLDFLVALCQTKEEAGTQEDRDEGKPEDARLVLSSSRDVGRGGILKVKIWRRRSIIKEIGWWKGEKKNA